MARAYAASGALFRDRDLFVHDGRKLRRLRLSSQVQTLLAILLGLLIAFSTYSVVRFLTPADAPAVTATASDDMVRLASATEQRVRIIEERQQLLAAMLAGDQVDPAVLRQIATSTSATVAAGAQGGPFEPVKATSDSTFKQLFSSWKKLDNLEIGAIAIPSEKPVKIAAFTSGYGTRADPFNGTIARHMGIDLAGPMGTPIYATADGVVSAAGWNNGGYGNLIKLDHGRGVETRYGHLSQILVTAGQHVMRGQMIAKMGSTGRSTGSHLHYEVRIEGKAVNPIPFMKSTDYLLAMQKNGAGAPMDGGHVALGGPQAAQR
jgi:murein DD-endopeptidase MepM/ murein hydrolase activator NlpD